MSETSVEPQSIAADKDTRELPDVATPRENAVALLAQEVYNLGPVNESAGLRLAVHQVPTSVFDKYDGTVYAKGGSVWKDVDLGSRVEITLFMADES